ncbi:MAG: hypothetical protein Q8P23_02250 [bacterium]|nr:hypothetical protein [bacterium]
MKKLLIIVLILMLLGFIAFWAFVGFGPKPTTTGGPSGGGSATLPTSGYVSIPTPENSTQGQSFMAVIGVGGTIIPTRDFLHDSSTGEYPTTGYFYLGYHTPDTRVVDTTATSSPPYLIGYVAATQYFSIELLSEPIGTTRVAAEQFLMKDLSISQSQMCQLSYMVAVPNSVNSQFAGKNLGFSFCPGATVLPK